LLRNCCGPIILAMECGAGGMEFCNLMDGSHKKPEYAKVNAYQQVPGMSDGDVCIGESNAILRYIALNYAHSTYPLSDPAQCAKIDMGLDAFSRVYKFHAETVYVVFGYAGPPADQKASNAAYIEAVEKYMSVFVEPSVFCGGDSPNIVDYKLAPFLFSACQPAMEKKIGLKMPPKVHKYCEAFCAKVGAAAFLSNAGGYSLKEYAATKE
jgi:glutathione S-transferase